jgi:hypothetical protein
VVEVAITLFKKIVFALSPLTKSDAKVPPLSNKLKKNFTAK